MKSVLLALTALSCGVIFAPNVNAANNGVTTSMGAPQGSPSYSAPRSAVVPGLPQQERRAQQQHEAMGQEKTDQGVTTPVQGPKSLNGKTQTNPGG